MTQASWIAVSVLGSFVVLLLLAIIGLPRHRRRIQTPVDEPMPWIEYDPLEPPKGKADQDG